MRCGLRSRLVLRALPPILRAACLAAAIAAAGCTVGPNYSRPEIDAPAAWRVEYQQAIEVANTRWWQEFGDPALDQLVDSAVRENLDVQIAAARVDQFLGALRTTRSQFYPQFDYGAEASTNRASAVGQPALPPGTDRDYSLYTAALAAIPSLERQVALQENLLSILLGRNPESIPRGKSIDQLTEPGIPGALPSTLLERRPDILEAEQRMRASNAQIGVAKSLYYPSLSLTGVLGLASTSLGDFVSSDATAGSLIAGLTGPIFTFGNIEGQVSSAQAVQRGSVAFYRQVVLNAFRETNDALIGVQKKREENAALVKRVEALRQYAGLSRLRFDNGATSYLEVLYAENELFGAELTAVRSRSERYGEVVGVYKAVGGGWVDLADPLAPQSAPAAAASASAAAAASAPSAAAQSAAPRAAASTPASAAATTAPPVAEQDRTAVVQEGAASVLNVYRVKGIGGVEMRAPKAGWPAAVVVRLHGFPALESFTAKTATHSLVCETQRPEARPAAEVCAYDGARVDAVRKAGTAYEVSLPAPLLAPSVTAIELRWVDQWR